MGYLIRWLAEHGAPDDVELVGIDIDSVLIDEATRLADERGLDRRFAVGDALQPDLGATVIVSTVLLHHLEPLPLCGHCSRPADGAHAWIGSAAAASIIGAGDPIARTASMVGYPTFAIEHMMYGMALAAFILFTSPATGTAASATATSRPRVAA